MSLTTRQADALRVLARSNRPLSPSEFASRFWPDQQSISDDKSQTTRARDSGRHGGKMLTALHRLGLVDHMETGCGYIAKINQAGRDALKAHGAGDEK